MIIVDEIDTLLRLFNLFIYLYYFVYGNKSMVEF